MERVEVTGPQQLQEFRKTLTGAYGLELVRRHEHLLVTLAIGVGKSQWMDKITVEAIQSKAFDLVVVLCPTRNVLDEREPLKSPPRAVRVVNLRPRSEAGCDPRRSEEWGSLETRGLSSFGRHYVCTECPTAKRCWWLGQYRTGLSNADIVYATQTHLDRDPAFVQFLKTRCEKANCLVLIDESAFLAKGLQRLIRSEDLYQFRRILRPEDSLWINFIERLTASGTADLRDNSWVAPAMPKGWIRRIQTAGADRFGNDFRFVAFELHHLSRSDPRTRERLACGDMRFSVRPDLGDACMIFSATISSEYAELQLKHALAAPFESYVFCHPETKWFNIRANLGARCYFRKNSPQIIDFFAELIVKRIREGRRPLLVSKKCFKGQCARMLAARFVELGASEIRLMTDDTIPPDALRERAIVPIIHYGIVGVNAFEDFDAVFCLNSYYPSPKEIKNSMWDINSDGTDAERLVKAVRQHKERETLLQAVGRVRPFTRPREVITFQYRGIPDVKYTAEFSTMDEARCHFKVLARRRANTLERAKQILEARAEGSTQKEAATRLGISERTVRNYENQYRKQVLLRCHIGSVAGAEPKGAPFPSGTTGLFDEPVT